MADVEATHGALSSHIPFVRISGAAVYLLCSGKEHMGVRVCVCVGGGGGGGVKKKKNPKIKKKK